MNCYLHIGTEKTATTTLQNFFNLNRDKLLDKGFLYTKSAGPTNNVGIALSMYPIEKRDELTSIHKIYTDEDFIEYQKRTKEQIKKEVETHSPKSLILSSEHFHSRLTTKDELYRLKAFLLDLGVTKLNVIVYLRDPSKLATSLYSTSIKSGSTAKSPPTPRENAYYENICNHQKTLETFGEVFGMETLCPRLFHKNEYKGGTIIHDFMHILDFPLSPDFKTPANQNPSLSSTGIKMMRLFNMFFPVMIRGKYNRLRKPFLKCFETCFISNKHKYTIPNPLIKAYDDAYVESNEWVRQKFFPQKNTLFDV